MLKPVTMKRLGIALFTMGLLGLSTLVYVLIQPDGRASLYQREVPARVYGTSGMLVFTGDIASSQGDYVTVCKEPYLPRLNRGCLVVKVGGPFVIVAGEISRTGGLK